MNLKSFKSNKTGAVPPLLFAPIMQAIGNEVKLSADEVERICGVLEHRLFDKKVLVLNEGEICRYQYFVLNGCLKIYYTDQDGNEHVVKFAPANWWAFDLESFFQQTPAFYNIQAMTNTETLCISYHHHRQLLDEIPAMEKFTRVLFQRAYAMLQQRLTQSLYANAEEKYLNMLTKFPGIQQIASQKDQASYIGVTPEFLSVMLKRKH